MRERPKEKHLKRSSGGETETLTVPSCRELENLRASVNDINRRLRKGIIDRDQAREETKQAYREIEKQ